MNLNVFEKDLRESFENFIQTIRSHSEVDKRSDLSYADWFDTFRAHEEVGTEEELMYHGPRTLSKNRDARPGEMTVFSAETWLSRLFGELIQRGIDSDEHLHFKDSPLGDVRAPVVDELKNVDMMLVREKIETILCFKLISIIEDYEK